MKDNILPDVDKAIKLLEKIKSDIDHQSNVHRLNKIFDIVFGLKKIIE